MSGTNDQNEAATVFAAVVDNRRNYTAAEFFTTLGWENDAAERARRGASDAEVRRIVRDHIQGAGGIHKITDLAGPEIGSDIDAIDPDDERETFRAEITEP